MIDMSVLDDIFFMLLYGGVTFLEGVAALYLWLRRANAIAPEVTPPVRLRQWAAVFLAAMAAGHLLWVFYVFHPSQAIYVMSACADLLLLVIPMSGTLLSMLQDRHRPVWPIIVALIPAVVLSVLCILLDNYSLLVPMQIYSLSMFTLFAVYMVFAVRSYGRWLRNNYADLEHKELWQSFLVLVVLMLVFFYYGNSNDDRLFEYIIQACNVLIVALLLWRVENLQQIGSNTPAEAESPDNSQTTALLSAAKIGTKLKMHCEDTLLFLQYNLTLSQLAQAIGTNRTYLSQYFASQGLTFNAYINGLRIRHFIRLYQEAVSQQRTVTALQLSSESGFRSYSTFSAAFKHYTGTTVTVWMRDAEKTDSV